MMEFKIFLTNLGKYNEGELIGKWVELPCDDLESELGAIGINEEYEEYFITDYENNIGYRVGEYESLEKLNELAEKLEGVDDLDWLQAYIECTGSDLEEALDRFEDNSTWYPGQDLSDVAYDLVEECYFTKSTPEIFKTYFDYEAFARDLSFDGYHETAGGVICLY